jgi:hypothetical protein
MGYMMEEHKGLSLDIDRSLISDVLDTSDLRYVVLFMFFIRKELFGDLEDDDIMNQFELLFHLEEPTILDLQKLVSEELLQKLFQYNVITNIKSYEAFQAKGSEVKVRLAPGLKLEHEEISSEEEEIHILCREDFLERVITSKIIEMTANRIHKALERLRAMMCPRTSVVHNLVKKFGDFYVLADDLYYIIEQLGNPYQALRVELMIRAMVDKYQEIERKLNENLELFDILLLKSEILNKFKQAKENLKTDYLAYLVAKSRKLPAKFNPKFPELDMKKNKRETKGKKDFEKSTEPEKVTAFQYPEIYLAWKEKLNDLIGSKLQFTEINSKLDQLKAYYSGAKQIMSYMSFIEKTSFDDEIADNVKNLLMDARNQLKDISDKLEFYDKKDLKILNLNWDRYIIEHDLEPEEEEV